MPTSPPNSTWAVALLGCALLIAGCGPVRSPAAHATTAHPPNLDEEDVPITVDDVKMPASYPEAVERIAGYCGTIRRAIEEKHPLRAHRPLDEMDIVLDRLPEIARDGGVPKRHWEQVVVAGEEIRDLFGEIHATIDDHRVPDDSAVAGQIEAALASLADVADKMEQGP